MDTFKFVSDESDIRADKFLCERLPQFSRNYIQTCFLNGNIKINGEVMPKSCMLKKNDKLEMNVLIPKEVETGAENIDLDIVYEDEYLLVVNKKRGMVVHPAMGSPDGTLVNALLYHCKDSLSGINGVLRPGIVHRIDKDTSGLLIVAKSDTVHNKLAEQIKVHSFKREYEAISAGVIKEDKFTINAPIGRHPKDRKKMAVIEKNSKAAITEVSVITRYSGYTHIRCKLKTGRTHQIRVHLSYKGYPLVGDTVYGGKRSEFKGIHGQCLHAKLIGFVHPVSNEYMEFDSELPQYFKNVLTTLEKML